MIVKITLLPRLLLTANVTRATSNPGGHQGKKGYGDAPLVRVPFFTSISPTEKHQNRKISPSQGTFFGNFGTKSENVKKIWEFQSHSGSLFWQKTRVILFNGAPLEKYQKFYSPLLDFLLVFNHLMKKELWSRKNYLQVKRRQSSHSNVKFFKRKSL